MKWDEELINIIARRRAVLFLGSGISANSLSADGHKHPPTWLEFLKTALTEVDDDKIKKYVMRLLREKDYLTACEILVNNLGEDKFERVAKDEFLKPKYKDHPIHKSVLELDSRIVITPNVDKIYEVYAQAETSGTVLVKKYYDSDLVSRIKSDERMILKIHGTLDESSKMIFTRSQYTAARYNHPQFYRMLEALSLTYTFVFLGCGLSDPDIQLVLENYSFGFPNSPCHYFVTGEKVINDEYKRIIQKTRNLKILTYNEKNNHKELQEGLSDLVKIVEAKRTKIAELMDW